MKCIGGSCWQSEQESQDVVDVGGVCWGKASESVAPFFCGNGQPSRDGVFWAQQKGKRRSLGRFCSINCEIVPKTYNIQIMEIRKQHQMASSHISTQNHDTSSQPALISAGSFLENKGEGFLAIPSEEAGQDEAASQEAFSGSQSGDSQVSFQQRQLDEHILSMRYQVQKMFQFFFKMDCLYEVREDPHLEPYETHHLMEYLSAGESLVPQPELEAFIRFLGEERPLKKLLESVFSQASYLLSPELILVCHRILRFYLPMRHQDLSEEELLSLARDPHFLRVVYTYPAVKYFSYARVEKESACGTPLPQMELYSYLQFYTQTVLLVLENYFKNPFYSKIPADTSSFCQSDEDSDSDGDLCVRRSAGKRKSIRKNRFIFQ